MVWCAWRSLTCVGDSSTRSPVLNADVCRPSACVLGAPDPSLSASCLAWRSCRRSSAISASTACWWRRFVCTENAENKPCARNSQHAQAPQPTACSRSRWSIRFSSLSSARPSRGVLATGEGSPSPASLAVAWPVPCVLRLQHTAACLALRVPSQNPAAAIAAPKPIRAALSRSESMISSLVQVGCRANAAAAACSGAHAICLQLPSRGRCCCCGTCDGYIIDTDPVFFVSCLHVRLSNRTLHDSTTHGGFGDAT